MTLEISRNSRSKRVKVVGVPFADYLVVYWDSQEAYFQKLEREAQEIETARERQGTRDALTETPDAPAETNAPAPSNSTVNRALGILSPLRAAFAHVASFFSALFSTPRETPEWLR